MDAKLLDRALSALGLSSVQREPEISDRAVSHGDAGRPVQAGEASSGSLSQRTSGTVTERFDESAIGRAATIARMTNDVEIYGVETFGLWFRNVAAMYGYTVTVQSPSPGTINDPRR
jgi:hypothetical protein